MNILGISAYYHDSAAALIRSGEIIAAAQEERFSRKKHDARFPVHAIRSCLEIGQVSLADLDYVVFYDKPLVKFERLLETYLGFAPKGFRCASDANLAQRKIVFENGAEKRIDGTQYKFIANDALIALVCQEREIIARFDFDTDFDKIEWLHRLGFRI
jgi:predicted NodU family carbamoyl transferase